MVKKKKEIVSVRVKIVSAVLKSTAAVFFHTPLLFRGASLSRSGVVVRTGSDAIGDSRAGAARM